MSERIVAFQLVHGGWSRFGIATVRLADGTVLKREIEDHGNAAAVLPYCAERRTALLVRQFRAPVAHAGVSDNLLEAPAGLIDEGETAEDCARREALEEAGVSLQDLELVARVFSMPGVSTEAIHLFLAAFRADQRVGRGGGIAHEHERLEVIEVRLEDLASAAERGELSDLKTLTLVLALRLKRPELFK